MSSPAELKALARAAWNAYDRCDVEAFEACVTRDWVEHDGDIDGGLAEMRDLMAKQRVAFQLKGAESG